MSYAKSLSTLFVRGFVYSSIILIISLVAVLFFTREISQVIYYLSLALLVEGGLGLVLGSAVAVYSPVVSKVSEHFFRSAPWNAKRQKEAEKQGQVWIATGVMLVVAGLLVSGL